MFFPSRRGVFLAGMIGAGLVAMRGRVTNPGRAQAGLTLRRHDVASPEGQEMLRIFAEAVGKMMATDDEDPRGWVFQWHIHAVRDDRSKTAELARLYPTSSTKVKTWPRYPSSFGLSPPARFQLAQMRSMLE